MHTWVKLHCSLNQSSISRCPYPTRLVWISLLSICGLDGIVRISPDCVAGTCNVTEDEAREAIRSLSSPDPNSKDPEFQGRRIERVTGGFRILNYFKYRDIKSPAHRAEYMRDYMKNYRQKKKKENDSLSWQEVYENEANDAFTLPIPAQFGPEVEAALIDFISYRMECATKPKRKQDRTRFSSSMLRNLFNETEIALARSSPESVAQRLRNAAISNYKAPRFQGFYDN